MENELNCAPVEDWTASELFDYLIGMNVIHPEEIAEDWIHDRTDMIKMVKEDIENQN